MDLQAAFNLLVGILAGVVGWTLKAIYQAITELRDQDGHLHTRINAIPNTYVRRDDFMALSQEIKATLNRIEDKLDRKVDR